MATVPTALSSSLSSFFKKIFTYLSDYTQVLVEACQIFLSCGMSNLIP